MPVRARHSIVIDRMVKEGVNLDYPPSWVAARNKQRGQQKQEAGELREEIAPRTPTALSKKELSPEYHLGFGNTNNVAGGIKGIVAGRTRNMAFPRFLPNRS